MTAPQRPTELHSRQRLSLAELAVYLSKIDSLQLLNFLCHRGGLPTEVLIQASVDANLLLCNTTWKVERPSPPPQDACAWTPMQWYAQDPNTFRQARMQLLEEWSIYNYQQQEYETPAEHFFKTFGKFSAAKVRRWLHMQHISHQQMTLAAAQCPLLSTVVQVFLRLISLEATLVRLLVRWTTYIAYMVGACHASLLLALFSLSLFLLSCGKYHFLW